jgi:adenylylsulfate kinase-like enzyme
VARLDLDQVRGKLVQVLPFVMVSHRFEKLDRVRRTSRMVLKISCERIVHFTAPYTWWLDARDERATKNFGWKHQTVLVGKGRQLIY